MTNLPLPASKTIQLRDNRILGYAEYGAPDGRALFYFHGHPGSRYEARYLEREAVQVGVRLIGIDQPGLGFPHTKPGASCWIGRRMYVRWRTVWVSSALPWLVSLVVAHMRWPALTRFHSV